MNHDYIDIKGARENNLKNIDIRIPRDKFVIMTGVSGSGKSSLVNEILYKSLAKKLNRARTIPGKHKCIEGVEQLDKIIAIDQSPIGRTPAPTRPPIPACSTTSVICSPPPPTPRPGATARAASPSTSGAGAARPARATAC